MSDVAGVLTVEVPASNGAVSVNITGATAYTDAAFGTSISMADSITATKSYFFKPDKTLTVSLKVNGQECATADGNTRVIRLGAGQAEAYRPLVPALVTASQALVQQGTATTATAGGGQAALATVLGYFKVTLPGTTTTVKIPYFSN